MPTTFNLERAVSAGAFMSTSLSCPARANDSPATGDAATSSSRFSRSTVSACLRNDDRESSIAGKTVPLIALLIGTLVVPTLRGQPRPPPKTPSSHSPALWGGGLTLAALLADRSIHREVTIRENGAINKALGAGRYGRSGTIMEMLGEPYATLGVSGVFYGMGVWRDDPRAARVGRAGAVAALTTSAATVALKWVVGRDRPYHGNDSDEYRPFHGTKTSMTAFPSGHASVSFAMASVIADEYEHWAVDTLSYGAAAAVSLSRVYQDRHWASDVVGGATLGVLLGKWAGRRAARKDGALISTDGRNLFWARRF